MNQTLAQPLRIADLPPIRVWDRAPGGGTWILPGLSHRGIVPTIWSILHQLDLDWREAASQFVFTGPPSDEDARQTFLLDAKDELTPRFIQCFFSYISFFYLLENGLTVLIDELKDLSRTLNLRLKHPKKPKRSEYIQKIRRVRNHTVVHWGGPGSKHQLDSRAGRYWGFSWSSAATTLVDMEFGGVSVVGASDRKLASLGETHRLCAAYLLKLDCVAANLLSQIEQHLPLTVGSCDYSVAVK